ncbi:hypothetical protein Rhopal_006588-T1 [Rhodotorula paludigena]|uniref:Uncharacterized protein n=1 Tax=Rhodotorula paludigena TaxID=86838 RepID=A0AAV5GML9_9BASI|nr:hypothetical protein Rhopal_006588-T1 [Rhodotorula paludigena]
MRPTGPSQEEAVERIADHLSYLPRAYQDALKRLLFDTTPRSRNRLSERGQFFAKNAMYLSWFDTVASLLMIRAQSGKTFDPDLFELYATAPWAIDAPRLDSERTFPTGAIVFDEYVDTRVLASSLPFSIFRLCLSLRSPGLSARDIQPPQAFVDRMDELYEAMRGPWNASVSAQRFKFSQEIKSIAEDFAANPLKSTDKNNWRFKKLRRALSRPEDLRPTEADGDPELYPPVKHHAVRRYSEIDLSERALHDLRAELRCHRSESPSHTGHHDPKSLGHQASLSQRRLRLLPSIGHRIAPRYFPGRTKADWEAAHRSFT